MRSPFPGMDPYIEVCKLWEDFHLALISEIRRALSGTLPARYVVRMGERSYLVLIESEKKGKHSFLPDVSVTTPRSRKKATRKSGTAIAEPASAQEPHILRAFVADEHREAFVEIFEAEPEMRLVTTVEVLSPSNKRRGTPGWKLYQRKRQSLLLGDVNLVEIDLLRGGHRMPMLDPWPNSPYTLMVAPAGKEQFCRVWEAHFQHPLPPISVPLAKPDPDISMNLQPLIDTIYQDSRYAQSIKYTAKLTPPLSPKEAAWCRQQVQAWSGS